MPDICPNYNSPEWIKMVETIGDDYAHDVFTTQGEVPILGVAKNGRPSELYEHLKKTFPKSADKIWYSSKLLNFKNKYGNLPKDENDEFVLTKKFISEYIVEQELDLPLFYQPIKELGSSRTTAFVKDLNFQFFSILFNDKNKTQEEDLLNLNTSLDTIYAKAKSIYVDKSALNPDFAKDYEPMLKYWNKIVENHRQYLNQFKINTEKLPDEDERTKDTTSQYTDSNSVNIADIVEDPIRLLIVSLPDVTRAGLTSELSPSDVYHPSPQDYNLRSTVNYNKIITLLKNELHGLSSEEQMIDKLKHLALKYPSLGILIKRLGLNSVEVKPAHLMLRAQFYRTFDNNKNTPLLGIVQDNGNIIFNDMALDTVKNVLKARWLNKAKELAENKAGFFKTDTKGKYVFDPNKLNTYTSSQVKSLSPEDALDFLAKLGFEFESNDLELVTGNHPAVRNFLKWFMEKLRPGDSLNDLFNRDGFKMNAEITSLLEAAALIEANDMDLMYINQEGKLEYPITLNSHLSKTVSRLNNYHLLKKNNKDYVLDDENLQHLLPFNPETGTGNHYTFNSKMFGHDVKMDLIKGLKADNRDGYEVSGLKMTDYKGLTFTAIMKGIIPTLRSADRKLEYALSSSIFATKLSQAETVFYMNDMKDYLKDELTLTFAFLRNKNGIGHDLLNASNHLSSLRTFDFLFEGQDLKDILKKFEKINRKVPLYSIQNKVAVQELADKFIEQYQESIDLELEARIKKSVDLLTQSLLLDGVIIDLEGTDQYEIKAIDKEALSNLIHVNTVGDSITVTKNQFKMVAQLVAYNYYIMAQEQLKLIFGDLANFKNPVQVQKRTNGGTSTKSSLNNSQRVSDMINSLYQFMDNYPAQKTAKEISYADIIISNKDLGDIFPEYKKIKSSDGQAHSTLDEYRRIENKDGFWGNKEKTYQYEQQWLGLQLLKKGNEDLQEIFPFTSEDFIRLFGEHTNKIVPDAPMYKGELLDELDLPHLPPLKPQGFGNKSGYREGADTFTTNDYYKMSVSPLFPSQLSKERLRHLLSMMKNGVGYLFFESTKKSDISLNKEGKINQLEDVIDAEVDKIDELNYDNFSLQLDIHDYFGKNVTQSTQRTRLEFLDLFLKGEYTGNDPEIPKIKAEFDAIINELIARDRHKLFDELGLELNDKNEYRLIDQNVSKFKKRLLDAFLVRSMPYNVVDGLIAVLDSKNKQFDVLVSKREIESVLLSLGRNDVLKRKIHGELLVQESNAYYGEDLKFYTNKNGKVTAMEVMIPLPKEWISYVKSVGGLDAFNKLVAEGKIDKRIITFPANRIPSHGHNSLEVVTVKKFLPPYVGTKIVLPGEITIKSGADFDVDKLTAYYKNVRVTDNGLEYISITPDLGLVWDKTYGHKIKFYESLKKIFSITDLKEQLDLLLKSSDENIVTEAKLNKYNINTETDFLWFQEEMKDIINNNSKQQFIKKHTNPDGSANILGANSKEALQNRLMEISEKVTLHPDRFNELIKPTNADTLSSYADNVEDTSPFKDELKKIDDGKWANTIELWYNMAKAESFWTAKSGLALTATHVVAHASQQHTPIKITSPVFKLYLDGDTNENTLGIIEDSDKKRISHILAEFVTAFVDAANDDFIFKINANPTTITSMLMLVRLGFDTELLVKLFTQPIIMDYLKNQSINNSVTYQAKEGYNDKSETIKAVLKKHGLSSSSINDMMYSAIEEYLDDPSKENLDEFKKREKSSNYITINKELLAKKRPTKGKNLEEALTEFNKTQLQILDNFLSYQQYGRMITKLQQVTRPEAGVISNRNDLRYIINLLKKIKDSNFFDSNDIDNFVNNSFLKESFVSRDEILKSISQFFIFEDKDNRALFEKQFKWLDKLDLPADKLGKIIVDIEENFTSALLLDALTKSRTPEKLKEYYERVFIGADSLAKEVLKLKKKLPNNALIKELTPLIQEFNTQTSKDLTYDNIKLYNRKLTTDETNLLVSAFEELNEDNNPKIRKFAADLMRFLIMQSGLSNSPINFIKIVPNKYLLSLVKELPDLSESDKLGLFKTIMRNSWSNSNIVPRQKGYQYLGESNRTPPRTINVKADSRNSLYPYIAKWTVMVSPAEKKNLQNQKLRVPKELIMYESTGRLNDNGKITYEIIGKLGDGDRITELYLRDGGNTESFIASNNIGYKFDKPTIVTRSKEKKDTPPETNWDDIKRDKSVVKTNTKEESLVKTNFNPTNVPEDKRLEYKKYVIDNLPGLKITKGGSSAFTSEMSQALDAANIKTNTGSYTITYNKSSFVLDFKSGAISNAPIGLSDIKLMIGLGKYIEDSNQQYSLGSEQSGESNEQLNSIMKNYLQAIKVDYKTVENISTNGKDVNVVAAVDLINKTVLAIEGKLSKRDLPEEAAHWYVELLGEDSNLYKVMMRDIVNYPEYREVMANTDYRELYNNDDTRMRKEAVGKLIANNILMEFNKSEKTQVYRWLNALWSYLKGLFGFQNPFAKSAYNIFNSKLEELKKTPEEVRIKELGESDIIQQLKDESTDVEVLFETTEQLSRRREGGVSRHNYNAYTTKDISKVNKDGKAVTIKAGEIIGNISIDIYKDNDVAEIGYSEVDKKYRGLGLGTQMYKNALAQSLENGYELKSGTPGTVSTEAQRIWQSLMRAGLAQISDTYDGKKSYSIVPQEKLQYSIVDELKKETTDTSYESILKDFDKLFPDYSYLTTEEKSVFVDAMNKGQIDIVCGF